MTRCVPFRNGDAPRVCRSISFRWIAEIALLDFAPMRTTLLLAAALALLSAPAFAAAEVGKPAPDFALSDLSGKTVKLSEFKGKTVVLEWFNPGCPFVRNSHTKGSLVDTAARHTKNGVVWLAINSGAPGKQGAGAEVNKAAVQEWKLTHPVLLDESGETGKAYGATNTPHMFVIDKDGKVAYRGAIDNSPDGERGSPQGGKLVAYVDEAIADLSAGKPVRNTESKAYGCSVKYK
jgi:peroxiredoxin